MVAVGLPHHVTQRGNARQDVFVSDPLRRAYLELLREHAGRNQLRILAYCLMTNHLHLVVVLEAGKAMANAFRYAHARFAQDWGNQGRDVSTSRSSDTFGRRADLADTLKADMSRVEQIEGQIQQLTAEELAALREWFATFDAETWDRQMEADARDGKLDRLAEAALLDHAAGRSTEL